MRPSGWCFQAFRAWKSIQVSYYGGKYSLHRLLALDAYTRNKSLLHLLLVCIGTPLPMISLVFIQEIIPLQDPALGWKANYGYWIRAAILSFLICYTVTSQATFFIDGITIPTRQLVIFSVILSAVFVACTMGIGKYFVFPIPFSILIWTPLFNTLHLVLSRVLMGNRVLQRMLQQRQQLVRFLAFVVSQISMLFLYPAYEAVFRLAEGSRYQLALIFLLVLMKVLIKNIVLRCTRHIEDIAPESVIFTVDFFNAIYVSTCMQSASSVLAISAITITDLVQTITMLYGLHRRTRTIAAILIQPIQGAPNNFIKGSLLRSLCALCRAPDELKKQIRTGIRIRSCFPYKLSSVDANLLDTLEVTSKTRVTAICLRRLSAVVPYRDTHSIFPLVNTKPRFSLSTCFQKRSEMAHPTTSVLRDLSKPGSNDIRPVYCPTFLRSSLEALFTMECLVVAAYLETVIPFFYITYMLVMVRLPNAKYHTDMAGVTQENVGATVFPVLVFGLLQVASFAVLIVVIKRNCGMQALYQLAFVLESQKVLIQGKLLVWMVIALSCRVVHFGFDFTFKFHGLNG